MRDGKSDKLYWLFAFFICVLFILLNVTDMRIDQHGRSSGTITPGDRPFAFWGRIVFISLFGLYSFRRLIK